MTSSPATKIAAIDPGLSGAVAFHVIGSKVWRVVDLPLMGEGSRRMINGASLSHLLKEKKVDHVVVERVHAMPGQGVSSMFRFGTVFGQILGVLQTLNIPYSLAEPSKWKRDMCLSGGPTKSEAVRQRAIELCPGLAPDLARKKDHNRAEAVLLACWWRERYTVKNAPR